MPDTTPQREQKAWKILGYVLRGFLALVLLLFFAPFLIELLYVGHHGMYQGACQSNMKQLSLALTQYEQDSDGIQPPVNSSGIGWREEVYPYVKAIEVYKCPADARTGSFTSTNLPRSYTTNHIGPDNHMNERGAFSGPGEPLVNVYKLNNPATTIVLADTRGENAEEWNMTDPAFLPNTSRELFVHVPRHLIYERVTGFTTVLLMDGHAKSFKPMATLTPVNLWTRDNAPFTGQDLSNAQAILKHAEDE